VNLHGFAHHPRMKGTTMIPATAQHQTLNSPNRVNEITDRRIRENVARFASATPALLDQRLCELEHEWDVERLTSAASGLILLASVVLALFLGEGWLVLPAIIGGCLLLHAIIGWTPALPFIRQLGFRTAEEIVQERYALKAIRGDFQPISLITTPQDREDLSRFEGEGGPAAEEPASEAGDPAIVNEALRATKC
jgi:hypothetical protein